MNYKDSDHQGLVSDHLTSSAVPGESSQIRELCLASLLCRSGSAEEIPLLRMKNNFKSEVLPELWGYSHHRRNVPQSTGRPGSRCRID